MSKKALLVDSDYFFVEFLAGLLKKRGYDVVKAYDGKEGITALEQGPFDIVFADLVMPKINGRQFFGYVRERADGRPCPLVALSGTMLEHMESLEAIQADYFIAKGPLERLARYLEDFVARIETVTDRVPAEKRIEEPGGVFPRRDALELLHSLEFHTTVIDSLGVGVILLDRDTRVLNANAAALTLLATRISEILNRPAADLFPPNRAPELALALRSAGREPDLPHRSFHAGFQGRRLRVVVSALGRGGASSGWVIALEGGCG